MTEPSTGGGSGTEGGQPHPASPPATLITDTTDTDTGTGTGTGTEGGQPHPAGDPTE